MEYRVNPIIVVVGHSGVPWMGRFLEFVRFAVCVLVGGLLTANSAAGQPPGRGYVRIKPSDGTGTTVRFQREQPELLPPLDGEGDIVLHAGGTVALRLPAGWQVHEVPTGREIRLYAAPARIVDEEGSDWQRIWLRHAPLENDQLRQRGEINEHLARRLQKTTSNKARVTGAVHEVRVGGLPAWRLDFDIPGDAETNGTRLVGYHLLARTGAGLFELHVALPENAESSQGDELKQVVESIRFRRPQAVEFQTGPAMADAVRIVGTWKAQRARWKFAPDGRVQVEYDRGGTFALDESGSVRYDRPLKRLDGIGTADADVLKITWDDGSRLNLRWTIHNGDLLVTDHTGRTSQLKRLFD